MVIFLLRDPPPSPLGERVGVRGGSSYAIPPHPSLSPPGRGWRHCCLRDPPPSPLGERFPALSVPGRGWRHCCLRDPPPSPVEERVAMPGVRGGGLTSMAAPFRTLVGSRSPSQHRRRGQVTGHGRG